MNGSIELTPIDKANLYLKGILDLDIDDVNAICAVIGIMGQSAVAMRDAIEKNLQPSRIIGQGELRAMVPKLDAKIAEAKALIEGMHAKYKEQHPGTVTADATVDGAGDSAGDGGDQSHGVNEYAVIVFDGGPLPQVTQ